MEKIKWFREKSKTYVIAITSIISITLVNQAVIQFVLQKKKSSVHVVNLAGRQRMLSQRIVKDAYHIAVTGNDDRFNSLQEMCQEWNEVNQGLQFGSVELGLPVLENELIQGLFFESNKHQHELFELISNARDVETIKANIERIDRSGDLFLNEMEKIVTAFENEDIPFQNLIVLELVLAIFALFIQLFEVMFIFTPLFIKLQKQNKRLIEIAYQQSHQVRAHVCTILGLIGIFDKENLNSENAQIVNYLSKEGNELDKITSSIVSRTNAV